MALHTLDLPENVIVSSPATTRADIAVRQLLVVDDHRETASLLRRLFEMEGYSVLVAVSAAEAAELAARRGCDLVISDVALPDRSGLDLMRELRDRHGLRGIAVSGFTAPADAARARDAGFQRFLGKPVEFKTLVRAVRELIASA